MKRIEDKVRELDLRLAVSESYIHEQIALGKKSGVEEEGNQERPNKRSKKN